MSTETGTLPDTTVMQTSKQTSRANVFLFACTSFLSAFLLFQVQLIVSKHILPWFGGSAAVWTTSMLVFQLLLLGGYIYSHLLSVKLSPSAQARVHLALLALAILEIVTLSLVWPSAITPGNTWKPLAGANPATSIAAIILVSVGLPFFALSTTGPLLQYWFGCLGGGAKTYRLYSVSNIGSLLGLLTFPFLIEPALRLKLQGKIWAVLFCVFAIACGACARRAFQSHLGPERSEHVSSEPTVPNRGRIAYVLWFLLAACASSLLLATTNLLCQEVITVPLLWVLPLAIYLLSFIVCFDHPRWYKRAVFHPLFMLGLFVTCAALVYENTFALLLTLPVLLFVACMVCHGELVNLKPEVKQLTSFYLAVSAGGAAGGIFVGVYAPRVFTSFLEFQLSLGLTIVLLLLVMVLDRDSWIFNNQWQLPTAVVALTLAISFAMTQWFPELKTAFEEFRFYPLLVLLGIVTIIGAIVLRDSVDLRRRGFRFVQILIGTIALSSIALLYFSARPNPAQHFECPQLLRSRSDYAGARNQGNGSRVDDAWWTTRSAVTADAHHVLRSKRWHRHSAAKPSAAFHRRGHANRRCRSGHRNTRRLRSPGRLHLVLRDQSRRRGIISE